MPAGGPAPELVHACCVAFAGRAVLILGPSGAGKSQLGLGLMALGAALVADDRVALHPGQDGPIASAPRGLPPLIEARGIGLLRAATVDRATVVLAVDLGETETSRLPPRHWRDFCGHAVETVHGAANWHFPAAIRQYILWGREE